MSPKDVYDSKVKEDQLTSKLNAVVKMKKSEEINEQANLLAYLQFEVISKMWQSPEIEERILNPQEDFFFNLFAKEALKTVAITGDEGKRNQKDKLAALLSAFPLPYSRVIVVKRLAQKFLGKKNFVSAEKSPTSSEKPESLLERIGSLKKSVQTFGVQVRCVRDRTPTKPNRGTLSPVAMRNAAPGSPKMKPD